MQAGETTIDRTGHPAVVVARQVGLSVPPTSRVDVLKEGQKSAVFRISWPAPPAASIIVKRCPKHLGEIEHRVYTHVLSSLTVTGLQHFGSCEDRHGNLWLVLEDAGDNALPRTSRESRALLTQWIADLHLDGARLAGRNLPDRGPTHYLRRLQGARAHLVSRLNEEESDADGRRILEHSVECCDRLLAAWPLVEAISQHFPSTVVHGDLAEENLRIVGAGVAKRVIPLDWEKAGWGLPAVDIVRVDPSLYWQLTNRWLCVSHDDFDAVLRVGRLFRVLSHHWELKRPCKLNRYARKLSLDRA